MNLSDKAQCKFQKEEIIASGKWLHLNIISYTDPTGKERTWESVTRTTRKPGAVADGVCAVPILRRNLHYDCIVLVKQFRPAVRCYTVEFPAGLMDANETPEQCALRELKEETGYSGIAKHTSPVTSLDPGVEASVMNIVSVEIDGDSPENVRPTPQQDEGGLYLLVTCFEVVKVDSDCMGVKFTEVITFPVDEMLDRLKEFSASGMVVDSRVYMYAISMQQTKNIKPRV